MISFADETADSLYRGVLAEPDNDLQRLVLADRLEEIGQEERAEFIRLQIEIAAEQPVIEFHRREWGLWARNAVTWYGDLYASQFGVGIRPPSNTPNLDEKLVVIRRGFPAEAWGTLTGLRGGECESCRGDRRRGDPRYHCHGCGQGVPGRTPGHLRELVRRWPITTVNVSDVNLHLINARGVWGLIRLPETLSRFVKELAWDTREAAVAALIDALLQEAKDELATP